MKKIFISLIAFALTIVFVKSSFSQEKLTADDPVPVLAWIGVPEKETTIERFKELKESGININFSSYSSIEAVEKALNIAQQTGVKLLPSCPELHSEPEKTAKRLMKHPALYGYHLRDEPNATDFAALSEWAKKIMSVDKKHPCYINLFPNYAGASQLFGKDYQPQPGKDIYADHVETFIKEVPAQFISFDHYPVIENNGVRTLRDQWYKNLEIVSAIAQKNDIPFWAFALSVAHKPYPIPTVGEIRLQQFSNLAYGAQVLQYFTYWNPGINSSWDFHQAPIGLNGKRTEVYDRIKQVNQEIQALAAVFVGAKLISVAHTGSQVPTGTRRLATPPEPIKLLETGDTGALVSVLEKANRRFMVVVNRNFQQAMKLTIATDASVKKVLKDGTVVPANAYTSTVAVDPGDVAIYTWEVKK